MWRLFSSIQILCNNKFKQIQKLPSWYQMLLTVTYGTDLTVTLVWYLDDLTPMPFSRAELKTPTWCTSRFFVEQIEELERTHPTKIFLIYFIRLSVFIYVFTRVHIVSSYLYYLCTHTTHVWTYRLSINLFPNGFISSVVFLISASMAG